MNRADFLVVKSLSLLAPPPCPYVSMQRLTRANEGKDSAPLASQWDTYYLSPLPCYHPEQHLPHSQLLSQYACKDAAFVIRGLLILRRFISCTGYRIPSNNVTIINCFFAKNLNESDGGILQDTISEFLLTK
jgi:hypothetical protein